MDFGFPTMNQAAAPPAELAPAREPPPLSVSPPIVAASFTAPAPRASWPWKDRGCLRGCLNPAKGKHHGRCPNYLSPGGPGGGGGGDGGGGARRAGILQKTWPWKERGCLRGCINPEKNMHHAKCPNFGAPVPVPAPATTPAADTPRRMPSALLAAALAPGTAAAAARILLPADAVSSKPAPTWPYKEAGCLRACVDSAKGLHHGKCPNYGTMLGKPQAGSSSGGGGGEAGNATQKPTPRPRPRPRPRPT